MSGRDGALVEADVDHERAPARLRPFRECPQGLRRVVAGQLRDVPWRQVGHDAAGGKSIAALGDDGCGPAALEFDALHFLAIDDFAAAATNGIDQRFGNRADAALQVYDTATRQVEGGGAVERIGVRAGRLGGDE